MTPSKPVTVVHCWSAPRSRSTALLYSFEARGDDCVAIDEPLYREWLVRKGESAVKRPYFREMVEGVPPARSPGDGGGDSGSSGETEEEEAKRWRRELMSLGERIAAAARALPASGGVVFAKHMAKHSFLYDFDAETSPETIAAAADGGGIAAVVRHRHLLLIRDPVAVLSSWGASGDVHGSAPTGDEVGIVPLLSIYSNLERWNEDPDRRPVILESDDLVSDPREALRGVCAGLGIPQKDSMMSWSAGPHACDGPWARWWYENVHKSTGWNVAPKSSSSSSAAAGTARYRTMNPKYMSALKSALPAYDVLRRLSLSRPRHADAGASRRRDPRNESLLVYVASRGIGRLLPADMAGVSPWDDSVQGGAGGACWEDILVRGGKALALDSRVESLLRSAEALGLGADGRGLPAKGELVEAIFRALASNGMRDGARVRLGLTRGDASETRIGASGATLLVLPEWEEGRGVEHSSDADAAAAATDIPPFA